MKGAAHFTKKQNNILVKHQSWAAWAQVVESRPNKVRNHCSYRVHTLAIWKQVTRAQGPDSWILDMFGC